MVESVPGFPPQQLQYLESGAAAASVAPSFADFQFKVIGKQPELLNRLSAPDPNASYYSPAPSISPAVSPVINRPVLSRPSLLQALASDEAPLVNFDNQPHNMQPPSANQNHAPAPMDVDSETPTSQKHVDPLKHSSSQSGNQHIPNSSCSRSTRLLTKPHSITDNSSSYNMSFQQSHQHVYASATGLVPAIEPSSETTRAGFEAIIIDDPNHTERSSLSNISRVSPHLPIQPQPSESIGKSSAANILEDQQTARDLDAMQARLQDVGVALSTLIPPKSPFLETFSIPTFDLSRIGQPSSNRLLPTSTVETGELHSNTEEIKACATQNQALIHTLQTNAAVFLHSAQALCTGLQTAETQHKALLVQLERERIQDEERRASEEEAKRCREEDLHRFATWREEVRSWCASAEERIVKAVAINQGVRVALGHMKEQEAARKEQMGQEEARAPEVHRKAAAQLRQLEEVRSIFEVEEGVRRAGAAQEVEKPLQEKQEAEASTREAELQKELNQQKQFEKRRAVVMAQKQQASMENAAKIVADRERENTRLSGRIGAAAEASPTTDACQSLEQPSSPFISSHNSNPLENPQTQSVGSVTMSLRAQKKLRSKECATSTSGGVKLTAAKEYQSASSTETQSMTRTTLIMPSVQPSSRRSSGSGTSGAPRPAFVPASTEKGRQVVTDLPFSSITLASEKRPKDRGAAPLSFLAANSGPISGAASSNILPPLEGLTALQRKGSSVPAKLTRAEQNVNLRNLRAAIPLVEESDGGDRSVRTGSAETKNPPIVLVIKKEDAEDKESLLEQKEASAKNARIGGVTQAMDADDVASANRTEESDSDVFQPSARVTTDIPPRPTLAGRKRPSPHAQTQKNAETGHPFISAQNQTSSQPQELGGICATAISDDRVRANHQSETVSILFAPPDKNQHDVSPPGALLNNGPNSPMEGVDRTPESPVSVDAGSDILVPSSYYAESRSRGREQVGGGRGRGRESWTQKQRSKYSSGNRSPTPPPVSSNRHWRHYSPPRPHSPILDQPTLPVAGKKRVRDPEDRPAPCRPQPWRHAETPRCGARGTSRGGPIKGRTRRPSPAHEWTRVDEHEPYPSKPSDSPEDRIGHDFPRQLPPQVTLQHPSLPTRPRMSRPEDPQYGYRDGNLGRDNIRDTHFGPLGNGMSGSFERHCHPNIEAPTHESSQVDDDDYHGSSTHQSLLARMSDTQKPIPVGPSWSTADMSKTDVSKQSSTRRGAGRGRGRPLVARLTSNAGPLQDRLSG